MSQRMTNYKQGGAADFTQMFADEHRRQTLIRRDCLKSKTLSGKAVGLSDFHTE